MTFETATFPSLDSADIDALGFGVVRMDGGGNVIGHNRFESDLSGLEAPRVLGRHFFSAVAPCMNNHMVAQKLEGATKLDEILSYVLALRIAPSPVRLRLMKSPAQPHSYLLVERV